MSNVKCKVHWLSERADERDDNNGMHHGIYIFDCKEEDFDPELGMGAYNVLEALWYGSEKERDSQFKTIQQ